MLKTIRCSLTISVLLVAAQHVSAQVDLGALQDEAVGWLQEYIRINTINPPGNEIRGAEFFARLFEAEGIEYEIAESAPGRGNIWARLEGGDRPGIVLLHHIDVVPADERYWDNDPLSGELRDGYIYGRGTRHEDEWHSAFSDLPGTSQVRHSSQPRCGLHGNC